MSTERNTAASADSKAGPNDRIRVGVIGCRNQGGINAASLLKSGQFEIVALCDCDEAMFKNALDRIGEHTDRQPALVTDFRELLDMADVDAVMNATPDHWHCLTTAMALDAGKHVYVEKPASYDIQDTRAMLAVHEKHPGLVVHVGSQQRSGPHFHEAKAFIDEGGLGTVAFCRAWVSHVREFLPAVPDSEPPATLDYEMWLGPAPFQPFNENRVHYNWRFMRDFGTGEMGNWGAHWLDVCLWYLDLGYPEAAYAHGGIFVDKDIKEWPDTQTVVYEYPELTMLWEQRLWTKYEVNGTGCAAEFDGDKGSLVVSRAGWTFYPKDGEPVAHEGSEQEVSHARNFADAIRGIAPSNAPIEEGCKSAALCHLGNIATLLGRRIAFDGAACRTVGDAEAAALEGHAYREPWVLPA